MVDDANAGSGLGKTGPVGHPPSLGDAERRLIERAFEAFNWRIKPELVVSEREVRAGAVETVEMLTGVAVRDVGDELFDAALRDRLFVSLSFTPEANLYYMPMVISRCVREIGQQRRRREHRGRSVGGWGGRLARSLVWQFRRHPIHLGRPVSAWLRLLDAAAGDKSVVIDPEVMDWIDGCGGEMLMDDTRIWFMVEFQPDDTYIWSWCDTLDFLSMMTTKERQVLVAFFDYLITCRACADEQGIASARALLAGRGVMDVLRIRTAAECIEIADAMQALETRHPQDFPPQEVAPVKNLLRDIAAGRRSPDTRLGW